MGQSYTVQAVSPEIPKASSSRNPEQQLAGGEGHTTVRCNPFGCLTLFLAIGNISSALQLLRSKLSSLTAALQPITAHMSAGGCLASWKSSVSTEKMTQEGSHQREVCSHISWNPQRPQGCQKCPNMDILGKHVGRLINSQFASHDNFQSYCLRRWERN